MAETAKTSGAAGNTAVPSHGDHDRVAMLSLRVDGTPDQHNPEIVGDKEFALEAAKEQFRQQAVSAVDQVERAATPADDTVGPVKQDPTIAELQRKHEAAEKAADSAAEATVSALFTDEAEADKTSVPASGKPQK